jgi:hypothetical protein
MPLEAVLETIQKERATGTLHLDAAAGKATLYFLFGHLFHAADSKRTGEAVVFDTLGWNEGDFSFDSKAKLPAEESIKRSTAELLAARAAGAVAPEPEPEPEVEVPVEPPVPPEVVAEVPEVTPEPAPMEDAAPAPEPSDGASEVPAFEAAETAESAPGFAEPYGEVGFEPPPEPTTELDAQPGPATPHPKRRRTDVRPGTRPPETMELYPVPMGEPLYESLTAAFVDFPKLLRSLAKDKHCGYVKLTGDDFNAVLVFSSGAVVEAIYQGRDEVSTGSQAFKIFARNIDNSEGSLDVIELSPEMVTAIYQLLTAPGLYDRLVARFVKFDALLEHLAAEGTSGAVIVRQEKKTGIVLFREGIVLGSYTEASRAFDVDTAKVAAICRDPKTQIEVRGGPLPEELPVLEADGTSGRTVPSGGTRGAAARAAAVAAESEAVGADAGQEAGAEPQTLDQPSDAASAEYPESPNGADSVGVDWAAVLGQMAGRADATLGTRAKKVKELLNSSGHDRESVDHTIERISELSIMFVDPSKLANLAEEMRQMAADAG